jgi:hypothetical protein
LGRLAQGLSAVAARMEAKEAKEAAAALALAMTKTTNPYALGTLARGLAAVAARMEPKEAAAALALAMTKTTNPIELGTLERGLSAVLSREDASGLAQRGRSIAAALGVGCQPWSVLAAPALLRPALRPLPAPAAAQLLVDLLKHPLFVGKARQVVLEQLARRYRRPFADQWEFVRFAKEKKLGLDFSTPPRRPGSPAAGR